MLQEIDKDLNILRDSVFQEIKIDDIYLRKIIPLRQGFAVISESEYSTNPGVGISLFNQELKLLSHQYISKDNGPNMHDFHFHDAEYSATRQLLFIVGSGCTEMGKEYCARRGSYILTYDMNTKKVANTFVFNDRSSFKNIEIHDDKLYISGEQTLTAGENKVHHDALLSAYTLNGIRLWQREFNYTNHETIYDMKIIGHKIHMVGGALDEKGEKFLHLITNLNGNLIEKTITGEGWENRFIKIYGLPKNQILLIGKSEGWRIIRQ